MCFSPTTWPTFTSMEEQVTETPRRDFSRNPASANDYRQAVIPKFKRIRGGRKIRSGNRTLSIPSDELKAEQHDILEQLKELRLPVSVNAHGYVRTRDITTMAEPHVGNKYLLRIDIKDFFPTTTVAKVHAALRTLRPNALLVNTRIINACFANESLPQGAPTSPALSNLVMLRIDARIREAIKAWRRAYTHRGFRLAPITYTRYADDLVFSSNYPELYQLTGLVKRILQSEGYTVNNDKIFKLAKPHRLEVCGVVVNEKLSKARFYRRDLRSMLHRIILQNSRKGQMRDHRGRWTDISFESIRSKIAHVAHVCASQGAPLQKLFNIAVEIHTKPQEEWSENTNGYINRYRIPSATPNQRRSGARAECRDEEHCDSGLVHPSTVAVAAGHDPASA